MEQVPLLVGSVMPHDQNENMAVSLAIAGLAFVVTLVMGGPIIKELRHRRIGKKMRIEMPDRHIVQKTGTPTMGGLMIAFTVVLVTAVFNLAGRLSMLLPIGVLIAAGTLGAVDDLMNIVGGKKSGITARFKFLWLMLFAIIAAVILHFPDPVGLDLHHIYVPFLGRYDIHWFYIPIAAFAIIAMSNAVNLADGLDTLAAGLAAIAFVAYGIIAYRQGQVGVVTFCFTMVGSLMGFLWFNAHPAQVFMGDTGSLAIGGALAVAAFMTGQWLLLPVVGFVFVAEALSVMIQVLYFKATKGKRIFRMTPLHHHFEQIGWSETQVTMRFWMVGMMSGLLGVALALL
jgi:phospho-N-acetylmuramoyl-pentapeptide-transferase